MIQVGRYHAINYGKLRPRYMPGCELSALNWGIGLSRELFNSIFSWIYYQDYRSHAKIPNFGLRFAGDKQILHYNYLLFCLALKDAKKSCTTCPELL